MLCNWGRITYWGAQMEKILIFLSLTQKTACGIRLKPQLGLVCIASFRFEPSLMPRNDLAILQTATPIIAFEQVYLQVCPEEIPEESLPMTLFGSCGMGKPETLGNSPKIATPELMETAFRSVPYHHYEGSDYIPCRIDNICTAPAIQGF